MARLILWIGESERSFNIDRSHGCGLKNVLPATKSVPVHLLSGCFLNVLATALHVSNLKSREAVEPHISPECSKETLSLLVLTSRSSVQLPLMTIDKDTKQMSETKQLPPFKLLKRVFNLLLHNHPRCLDERCLRRNESPRGSHQVRCVFPKWLWLRPETGTVV